jgi:hypothetical protein
MILLLLISIGVIAICLVTILILKTVKKHRPPVLSQKKNKTITSELGKLLKEVVLDPVVFIYNLPKKGNSYSCNNASDARKLCNSIGAQLATYDQLADAWSSGAEW